MLLQPDVGQSALLTVAFVIVFFVAGLPWLWATGFAVGGAGLGAGLYYLLPHVRKRVDAFLFPSENDTYQIDRARAAIERGGLFGVGPGEGTVKRVAAGCAYGFRVLRGGRGVRALPACR